jgi:hypothetical protein
MPRASVTKNGLSARFGSASDGPGDEAFARSDGSNISSPLMPEALRQAFDRLCPGAYMLFDNVVLIHAPGTRFPTSKIDYLAVTSFGVFAILEMNFGGVVQRGPDLETVRVIDDAGEVMHRTSPIRRQASTLRCLRALLLPQACPVDALAVPGALPCSLHPLLPESIMDVSELYHYLRLRMMRFLASAQWPVDLDRAVETIATRVDSRLEALSEHRARAISVATFL